MGKIRVLVVDDSVVIRRVVSEVLGDDPDIEVVGTASNGKIAIDRLTQVNPDLITLDVEMPELDGLGALKQIRKTHPRLPVIMFSAITERGAEATLDALAFGASDYFTKPTSSGGLDESRELIRKELIPAIRALCKDKIAPKLLPLPPRPVQSLVSPSRSARIDVVGIGVSTGGPNALAEVFQSLTAELPVPVLIVQHMPPMFTRLLAERLTASSKLPCEEAMAGVPLRAGHAWIAPGDYHMVVARQGTQATLSINQDPPESSCRPAADPLFRSMAKVYGPNCLAVVLTGMGQDGLRGCEAIRAAGGQVIVQDEASSVVWGMPGHVARAGLAEKVLPLAMIGAEIIRRVVASRGAST